MLKILDRYILGKFLGTFFYVVLIFALISVVVELADKTDKFIEQKVPIGAILFDYTIPFLLHINGLLWPLYTLIAVIFVTSRLAYNSEIISILNGGVSFRRLLRPYLIGAALIAGMHTIGNHFVIPQANKSRLDFKFSYIKHNSDKGKKQNVHMGIDPNTNLYVRYYNKRDTSVRDLRLETFEDNRLVKLVKASKAEWLGPPNRWRLRNFSIRTFNGLNETLVLDKSAPMDTTIALTPRDFVRYDSQKEMIPTPRLTSFIEEEKQRGVGATKVYEVELHRRTADSFTIFILTLIGVAVAARKVRGGMGLHLAIGITIGAVYIFLSRFTTTFAMNQVIPVLVGVWVPNILFTAVAVYLIAKAQK